MFIPSIDLFDGKAVQWRQGQQAVLERDDVFELLDAFSLFGEVAIVDLNAALGKADNRDLIHQLLRRHPCRVGGGIRDKQSAMDYIKAGASKVVLGTAAREPFVRELPREAVVVALDSKADTWVTHGWTESSPLTTQDAMAALGSVCSEFLYTQVEKEGMMSGLDRERVERVVTTSPVPVTVAGGVTTADDISYLHRLGAKAQIGMAIYTGALSLTDCLLACLDFDKAPLVPTVVQDVHSREVLMVAYSSQESLSRALASKAGVYYSRSRQALWTKGETSGHRQKLVRVDVDCDGDSLLFQVEQTGPACHLNRPSCFSTVQPGFDLTSLDRVIQARRCHAPEGSYTATLFESQTLRESKLNEEVAELIEATSFSEKRWEAADLLYFTLVEAAAHDVRLIDIISELRSRHADH
ncbi:MAG: bifunctional phosphoribosyl-AMP cyclohydrolase/phosphoribosyl-ATP diphosphatase HisIE [Acidobacteria bacterium]|nr:bifunctional phosphoribosyl-AMP cyclohydrolase/phosphoribosyl-ATP diphosphatase HisIE [Acidobacteriota bacterium]